MRPFEGSKATPTGARPVGEVCTTVVPLTKLSVPSWLFVTRMRSLALS
jgi:hypothetical protein